MEKEKKESVSFSISKDIKDKFNEHCDKSFLNKSKLVEDFIKSYLHDIEKTAAFVDVIK
jgi:hypothetical protein